MGGAAASPTGRAGSWRERSGSWGGHATSRGTGHSGKGSGGRAVPACQWRRRCYQARMSSAAAVLVCVVAASTCIWGGQVFTECPDMSVLDHFDLHRFQGLWYEVKRQPNPYEPDSVCVTGNVSVATNGTVVIVNKWFNIANSQHVVLEGTLRRASNTSQNGKMIVNYRYNRLDLDYWVLGTDYQHYTVVWSCMSTGVNECTGYAWVLGRSKTLSEDAWSTVHDIEERNSIDTSLYEHTRQSNCPTPPSL